MVCDAAVGDREGGFGGESRLFDSSSAVENRDEAEQQLHQYLLGGLKNDNMSLIDGDFKYG